jgi:hypothetical protein
MARGLNEARSTRSEYAPLPGAISLPGTRSTCSWYTFVSVGKKIDCAVWFGART